MALPAIPDVEGMEIPLLTITVILQVIPRNINK